MSTATTVPQAPWGTKPAEGRTPCPKCHSQEPWGSSSWCPKCGYYPRLEGCLPATAAAAPAKPASAPLPPVAGSGTAAGAAVAGQGQTSSASAPKMLSTVTADPAALNTAARPAPAEQPADSTAQPAVQGEPTVRPNLWALLPNWARVLLFGMLAVLAANVVARVLLPEKGPWRTVVSLGEILLCSFLLGISHLSAYMYAIKKSDRVQTFDFLLKPVEIWSWTFRVLPEYRLRMWGAGWSVAGLLGAVFIVGSLRYEALFEDWGFKQPPPSALVAAIADSVKEDGKKKSMEEALDEFAGKSGAKDLAKTEPKKPAPRSSADCLIMGYTERGPGDINTLVLACLVDKKLQFVGTLAFSRVPEADRATLQKDLAGYPREKPLVKCPVAAKWLQPIFMCRVSYSGRTDNDRLKEPEFQHLLERVNVKK